MTARKAQPKEFVVSEPVGELLWQLKAAGITDGPLLEYRFHKVRKWRFDLAFPDVKVAVEVSGGAWVGGRHVTGSGFEADCEKYSEAAVLGWRIVHCTPRQIKDGLALRWIEQALAAD